MFANIDNPPLTVTLSAPLRIEHNEHGRRLSHIIRLLHLAARARAKASYSKAQCESHSFLTSPFVSKNKWEDDMRKWSYIGYRLERFYFKKLCELNSLAYREMTE